MKRKIVRIFVCTLMIATTVLSAVGTEEEYIVTEIKNDSATNQMSTMRVDHGMILVQDLDPQGRGYTVLRLWGSFYEMGYARAQLLGDSIVQELNVVKAYFSDHYIYYKGLMEGLICPADVEDEINGMVDSLTLTHPEENISYLDMRMINNMWTCYADFGCRAHTCWGRYVADPIKTLATQRTDLGPQCPVLRHHVLCSHDPDDGSPRWVSFDSPGNVAVSGSVNEYGILLCCHAWFPMVTNISAGRDGSEVLRYALTFAEDPDLSHHSEILYEEFKDGQSTTKIFINFYTPEGYGGVWAYNPANPGPSLVYFRGPNASWHHGEAMITTNYFTDGSYTPPDEDFGADAYYNDETPKTQESHWDLLVDHPPGYPLLNHHMMSVAYRDHGSMTIWADGIIDGSTRTPRLEYEYSDLFDAPNQPPAAPVITGPAKGKVKVATNYNFTTVDSDNNKVYYFIDWGDQTNSSWIGPYPSGDMITEIHSWSKKGTYIIKAKAMDIYGNESDWGTLEITMPFSYTMSFLPFWARFLERFPHTFLILRYLIGS